MILSYKNVGELINKSERLRNTIKDFLTDNIEILTEYIEDAEYQEYLAEDNIFISEDYQEEYKQKKEESYKPDYYQIWKDRQLERESE